MQSAPIKREGDDMTRKFKSREEGDDMTRKFKSREEALEAALRDLLKHPHSQDAKIAAQIALASTGEQFK